MASKYCQCGARLDPLNGTCPYAWPEGSPEREAAMRRAKAADDDN